MENVTTTESCTDSTQSPKMSKKKKEKDNSETQDGKGSATKKKKKKKGKGKDAGEVTGSDKEKKLVLLCIA